MLETSLVQVRDALAGTDRQKNRLYELLELGEYDLELFRERMAAVKEKRVALEKKEAELERSLREIQCSNPALLAEKIRALGNYGSDYKIPPYLIRDRTPVWTSCRPLFWRPSCRISMP